MFAMDSVDEDIDAEATKVSVADANGALRPSGTSTSFPGTASPIDAPLRLSSESSVVSSPLPFQQESKLLAHHILEPVATAKHTAPGETRATEMSIKVEPSSMTSAIISPSSSVVSLAPNSLPSDTAGLVLPPSSPAMPEFSAAAAPGIPFAASSASMIVDIPMYATPLTSTSLAASSTPHLSSALSGDTREPDAPPSAVEVHSSAQLLTVSSSSSTAEGSRPPPLEMPSSRPVSADMVTEEASLLSSVSRSNRGQRYVVLSSANAPSDSTATLQTSTSSRSAASPADALSHSIEGPTAFLAPGKEETSPVITSSSSSPLADVLDTEPVALSKRPVGAAATGLLSEHESSSRETSASVPSGLKNNPLKRQRSADEEGTDGLKLHKRSEECKAGNSKCGLATGKSVLLGDHVSSPCNICCVEPGFCRECKCILCCKTIEPDAGESTFVRCVSTLLGNGMCGHAAHLECSLKSKMAGVVKERGLDMEYLCRVCDIRTDLRELVTLLLEAVGNTDVRAHAEKSLKLALEVMTGTERGGSGASILESLVRMALKKVQSGVDIQNAFKELKDQGAAAEAARQQKVGRGLSAMEDAAQEPEASLDQWLPSSGSPSSHPSPGTPSSFTSPRLRSNPSVTSGQLNGAPAVNGSLRKQHGASDHGYIDQVAQPQSSHEGVTNSKYYKNSHLGNKALTKNAGQERGNHRGRAVSSNFNNNNGLEAICDSFTRAPGNHHMADPGSRDGKSSLHNTQNSNSGTKNLKDQRNPSSSGVGRVRDDALSTEICKSCVTVKRHSRTPAEITSSLKAPKLEDRGNRVQTTSREEDPGDFDPYNSVGGSDTGGARSDRLRNGPADGSAHKTGGTSAQLLDLQCEQDMQAALQKLRRAQEAEFERAKACLTAKKESILRKYESVEASCLQFSENLVSSSSLEAFDELLLRTGSQFAGAIEERASFKAMLTIGGGFGRFSRDDLKKFYRWPPVE